MNITNQNVRNELEKVSNTINLINKELSFLKPEYEECERMLLDILEQVSYCVDVVQDKSKENVKENSRT